MSRRDVLAFAIVSVLLVALSWFAVTEEVDHSRRLRPSTHVAAPGGARALLLTLQELGIPSTQRQTAYVDADSLAGPLVLLAPDESPTPAELDALLRWVRAGGTLLYGARPGDLTLGALGLTLTVLAPDSMNEMEREEWRGEVARPAPHPWTAGLGPVRGFRYALTGEAVQRREARVLLRTAGGPAAVLLPVGRGRVVALADVAPLTNGAIGGSGAATLFARAAHAARAPGQRVVFDEYHHGYRAGASPVATTLRFVRDTPAGHAALQLALAAAGLLLLHGRRFGAPLPAPAPRRRDPLEHVAALGEAYRRAEARRTAARLLLAGLARRLGQRGGTDGEEALRALRRGLPPAALADAEALEREWRRGRRTDVVRLAADVDRIFRKARPG